MLARLLAAPSPLHTRAVGSISISRCWPVAWRYWGWAW